MLEESYRGVVIAPAAAAVVALEVAAVEAVVLPFLSEQHSPHVPQEAAGTAAESVVPVAVVAIVPALALALAAVVVPHHHASPSAIAIAVALSPYYGVAVPAVLGVTSSRAAIGISGSDVVKRRFGRG